MMAATARGRRVVGIAALLLTAVGWGLGWVAMKLVLQSWTPLFGRGLAGLCAAVLLLSIARLRGECLAVPRDVHVRLVLAAFTNVFAWMGFSALCLRWIDVGEGTLLVYTMPIWATLFAWALAGRRPTPSGSAALVLGLGGIVVLLGAGGKALDIAKLPGVGFALCAAVLFAIGAVLNSRPLPLPPFTSVAWQVGLGCLPMAVLGFALERPAITALTPTSACAMLYLALIPMSACYLLWFAALRRLPPAAASTTMLLVPIIGTLSATQWLGESLAGRDVLAMVLTLGGVVLALVR